MIVSVAILSETMEGQHLPKANPAGCPARRATDAPSMKPSESDCTSTAGVLVWLSFQCQVDAFQGFYVVVFGFDNNFSGCVEEQRFERFGAREPSTLREPKVDDLSCEGMGVVLGRNPLSAFFWGGGVILCFRIK